MEKHVLQFGQLESWHQSHTDSVLASSPGGHNPSRRRFLGSTLALSSAGCVASQSHQVQARATSTGFAFHDAEKLLWAVDARWLADPATIRCTNSTEYAEILIPRCSVPGTGLAFALRLRVDNDLVLTAAQANGKEARIRLAEWLHSTPQTLPLGVSRSRIHTSVGEGLVITQRGAAQLFLVAPFSLRLEASDPVFTFAGDDLSGKCDTCFIGAATDGAFIDSAVSVARLEFAASGKRLRLRPRCLSERFNCKPAAIDHLRVEIERIASSTRQAAYGAWVAQPMRLAFRPQRNARDGYVTLEGMTYGVHATRLGRPSYLLLANRANAVVRLGDIVYQGSAANPVAFRLKSDGNTVTQHLAVKWDGITMEQDAGISACISFKGDGIATTAYSELEQLLDNVPWHSKQLCLDEATVEFSRPDDALLLIFRFTGFNLARHRPYLHLVPNPKANDKKMLLDLGSQSWSERAFFEAPDTATTSAFASSNGTEPIVVPSQANLAGNSVLAFSPLAGPALDVGIPLDLTNLLNRAYWRLHVEQHAPVQPPDTPTGDKKQSTDVRTRLEIPWRLYISPAESAILSAAPLAKSRKFDLTPLFALALLPPSQRDATGGGRLPGKNETGLPLRAIDSPDYDSRDPTHPAPEPFNRNLEAQHRNQLVWLTSATSMRALLGSDDVRPNGNDERNGIYVPRPFYAQRLLLTSFGASLRSSGVWDPPRFLLDDGYHGVNVQGWEHISTLGRDHYDRVVVKGFLLPYGHYATLITETRRELRLVPGRGVFAVPTQRDFLSVVEPEKSFPAVGQPTESLYQTCQPEKFTIMLSGQLQLADPVASQIAKQGKAAFWIRVKESVDYPMPIRIGANGHGQVTMAFVANSIVGDLAKLNDVVNEYNKSGSSFDALGSRVRFAPEDKPGDTSFVTHAGLHKVVIAPQLVNSVLLESARPRQPPFYPVLDYVEVELNAAGRLQEQAKPPLSRVSYANVYRLVGFGATSDHSQNPLQLFLSLQQGVKLQFTGNSERSGGIATPNMTANMVSRSHGLVADNPLPANWAIGPATLVQSLKLQNPFDTDAKLLGLLPLSFFFESVGLGELPQLIESVAYRIDTVAEKFVDATKLFMAQVADTIQTVNGKLDEAVKHDPISGIFLTSGPGQALRDHLNEIGDTAKQAAKHDEAALIQDVEVVARDLMLLQKDLDALAELPQVLAEGAAAGFISLVSTSLPAAIDKALQQQQKALLQEATTACNDAATLAKQLYFETVNDVDRDLIAPYMAEIAEAQAEAIRVVLRSARAQLTAMAKGMFDSHQADQFLREGLKYLQLASDLQQGAVALRQAVLSADTAVRTQIAQCAQAAVDMAGNTQAAPLLAALQTLASQIEKWLRETVGPGCPGAYMRIAPSMREMVRRARVISSIDAPEQQDAAGMLQRLNACRALLASIEIVRGNIANEAATGCVPLQQFAADTQPVVDALTGMQANIGRVQTALAAVANTIPAGLHDFATTQLRNYFATLVTAGQAYDFQTFNEAAIIGVLDAVTGALDRRITLNAVTKTAAAIDSLQQNAAKIAQLVWEPVRTVLVFADKTIASLNTGYTNLPQWQKDILEKLLGTQAFADMVAIQVQLNTLLQGPAAAANPGWVNLAVLPQQLADIVTGLDKLLVHLQTAMRGLDRALLRYLQDQVSTLVAELVPARTSFNFDLKKQLDRDYGGVFLPGLKVSPATATFTLRAVIDVDLMKQTVKAHIEGALENFRISLMSVMILPVQKVQFVAGDGGFHLDPPEIGEVELLAPLDFIAMVQKLLGTQDGLFVTPGFNHIRAGYRFARPLIELGGVTIQNLVFEAAMEIPFDDRPALFSVACGTQNEPCLISVGIYGGGFFLELTMAGSHLVSIESDFCFGLVGAFSLAMVEGSGRVVVQIHYRQASGGSELSGFFYAGGSATVLNIVSISADLHVPLFHSSGGDSGVGGQSTFGVTIGVGIFSWTLHFQVGYTLAGIGAAMTTEEAFTEGEQAPNAAAPPHETFTDTSNLLDESTWNEYLNAFDHGRIGQ